MPLYYLAYFARPAGRSAERPRLSPPRRHRQGLRLRLAARRGGHPQYAVKQTPGDANAHLHLGNLYANLGRTEAAVQHGTTAVRLGPPRSMALRNLGLAWAKGTTCPGPSKALPQGDRRPARGPDALPRPGRNPHRRRASGPRRSSCWRPCRSRAAARRDHRHAGPERTSTSSATTTPSSCWNRRPISSTGKGRTLPG